MIKFLRIVVLICIGLFLAAISLKLIYKVKKNNVYYENRKNLYDLSALSLDSLPFDISTIEKEKLVVVIFFNPECEYCIYEIKDIIKNIHLLSKVKILMISDVPMSDLRRFSDIYQLDKIHGISILHINYEYYVSKFGSPKTPTSYIYDSNRELISVFKGETSTGAFLRVLKENALIIDDGNKKTEKDTCQTTRPG